MLELFYSEKDRQFYDFPRLSPRLECDINLILAGIPLGPIKPRPSISSHPLSKPGLDWVSMRLRTCLSEHMSCSRAKKAPLPKRVLAFDASPGGRISVYLLEDGRGEKEYATLSHCWGSHKSCITKRTTLRAHKKGISWSRISQTFQDSIRFCLAIGIHHLWIDALCIIQDDDADWQRESAKMADIFQNSYITLAATSSRSDAGGCFRRSRSSMETNLPNVFPYTYGLPHRTIRLRDKVQH